MEAQTYALVLLGVLGLELQLLPQLRLAELRPLVSPRLLVLWVLLCRVLVLMVTQDLLQMR